MDKNTILISAIVLFKEVQGKTSWFILNESEDAGWEFPKVIVRKGESSVRAAIRITGEKGGMTTKVLEEVGRVNSVKITDKKTIPQRLIYYIMVLKASSKEAFGFGESLWLEYSKAGSKLTSKKDKAMLKSASDYLKKWKKDHPGRKL